MAKDKLFLDTDVALDHLADRQPFAEHAHRLLGLAEVREVRRACLRFHSAIFTTCSAKAARTRRRWPGSPS